MIDVVGLQFDSEHIHKDFSTRRPDTQALDVEHWFKRLMLIFIFKTLDKMCGAYLIAKQLDKLIRQI